MFDNDFADIHTSYFGPWRNHWGYVMEFAVIDDVYILKTLRPDRTKVISYHWSEQDLEHKIDLYNQDRHF